MRLFIPLSHPVPCPLSLFFIACCLLCDVSSLHQTKKSGSVPEAGQIVAPSGENSR